MGDSWRSITRLTDHRTVAFVLPLASGSAAAAKSVMIEMCPASEKADALSAIALVEMIAMVTTSKTIVSRYVSR